MDKATTFAMMALAICEMGALCYFKSSRIFAFLDVHPQCHLAFIRNEVVLPRIILHSSPQLELLVIIFLNSVERGWFFL